MRRQAFMNDSPSSVGTEWSNPMPSVVDPSGKMCTPMIKSAARNRTKSKTG